MALGTYRKFILVTVLTLAALLSISCEEAPKNTTAPSTEERDQTPPTLYNLAIAYESYNAGTNSAGAIDMSMDHPFVVWKDSVWGHTWPDICYFTEPGYPIYSPINGVVDMVSAQHEDGVHDYEIVLKEKTNSAWMVSLDHLSSPQVSAGQAVTAGQIIAYTSDAAGAATTKFLELDIYGRNNANPCPVSYLHSSVQAEYSAKITNMMQTVETQRGNTSIYDEAGMTTPGCYPP